MAGEIKEVLLNDGEGLDFADLHNMQRYERSQLWDSAIASRIRAAQGSASENSGTPPVSGNGEIFAYGGSYVRPGASNRQLQNRAGLILINSDNINSNPNGDDAKFRAYYLGTNELNLTTAVGDATNPRIDLVCVQLAVVSNDAADNQTRDFKDATTGVLSSQVFVKKRKITLASQVVQGTPGSVPAEPAVPSGWHKLGGVLVPANHNTTHDWGANGRDYRFPAGTKVTVTHAFGNGPGVNVESGWATAITSGGLQSSAASQVVRIFPAAGSLFCGRLLKVSVLGDLAGATVSLVRRYHDVAPGNNTDTNPDTVNGAISATGVSGFTSLTPGAHQPLWLNGRFGGGHVATLGTTFDQETLCLKIISSAANQTIRFVKWEIAEI